MDFDAVDEVSLDNLSGSNSTVFLSERGASMMPQVDESGGTNYRPVSNTTGSGTPQPRNWAPGASDPTVDDRYTHLKDNGLIPKSFDLSRPDWFNDEEWALVQKFSRNCRPLVNPNEGKRTWPLKFEDGVLVPVERD